MKPNMTFFKPIAAQKGMTMIELLITILVSAIGLLGIAALQATALKGSMDSSQRATAAAISNDIIDRLKANTAGRNADDYSDAFDTYSNCAVNTAAPANICTDYYNQTTQAIVTSTACTAAQLATFDAWELSCGYVNASDNRSSPINFLVSPTISLTCTDSDTTDALACSDNSTHAISITWDAIDKDNARNGVAETHSVTFTTGI